MKLCTKCGSCKEVTEFYVRPNGKAHSWCKACVKQIRVNRDPDAADYARRRRASRTISKREMEKDARLRYNYGIGLSEYRQKLEAQNYCCAICGVQVDGYVAEVGTSANRPLDVDHDEATGLVRGLLCGSCNRGIGMFQHSVGRLKIAAMYLEYWHARAMADVEAKEEAQTKLARSIEDKLEILLKGKE